MTIQMAKEALCMSCSRYNSLFCIGECKSIRILESLDKAEVSRIFKDCDFKTRKIKHTLKKYSKQRKHKNEE